MMAVVAVAQDEPRHRYVVTVGESPAGFTRYVERGIQRVFVHTEIETGFEGQGLATTLIREALQSTRDEGHRIIAVCPFVARYVESHHDFDDILDRLPEPPQEL